MYNDIIIMYIYQTIQIKKKKQSFWRRVYESFIQQYKSMAIWMNNYKQIAIHFTVGGPIL